MHGETSSRCNGGLAANESLAINDTFACSLAVDFLRSLLDRLDANALAIQHAKQLAELLVSNRNTARRYVPGACCIDK